MGLLPIIVAATPPAAACILSVGGLSWARSPRKSRFGVPSDPSLGTEPKEEPEQASLEASLGSKPKEPVLDFYLARQALTRRCCQSGCHLAWLLKRVGCRAAPLLLANLLPSQAAWAAWEGFEPMACLNSASTYLHRRAVTRSCATVPARALAESCCQRAAATLHAQALTKSWPSCTLKH